MQPFDHPRQFQRAVRRQAISLAERGQRADQAAGRIVDRSHCGAIDTPRATGAAAGGKVYDVAASRLRRFGIGFEIGIASPAVHLLDRGLDQGG